MPDASPQAESRPDGADEGELFAWVASVCGGPVTRTVPASGGNRCRSWSVDAGGREVFLRYAPPRPPGAEPYTVQREADVYRAIAQSGVQAPALLGQHPVHQAILTTRARGIAEFRHLRDSAAKQVIAAELMDNLARLHRMDARTVHLAGGATGPRIAGHVQAELTVWEAMYHEAGATDPLLDLAFRWLRAALPDPSGPVVLVHGDAGPGNFLFENGRLTALIDWELAHLGDPMEDLAWFSMRCVMEPVPDFAAAVRAYEQYSGTTVNRARVLYHRVLVSTRVVVIRHRNVTGEPAHTIVSRALNRRLLTEALADAAGVMLSVTPPVEQPPTPRTGLFDHMLEGLRDPIVARSTDPRVIATAKDAAKVAKYLQAFDRYGAALAAAEQAALDTLLGPDATPAALQAAVRDGTHSFEALLQVFAGQAARQAQLAAAASGGIAARHYPPL